MEQEIFFALLRHSLWGTSIDTSTWRGEWQWKSLLETIQSQALTTLMADSIFALPKELQPDAVEIIKLSKQVGSNMRRHGALNADLIEIFQLFQSNGLHPVLLKGQGNATFYNKPLLRKCGDIDIYIGTKDIDKACSLLKKWRPDECKVNKAITKDIKKHADFHIGKTDVELHRYCEIQYFPYSDEAYQSVTCREIYHPSYVNIECCKIPVPSVQFNALFVFNHLWGHVRRGGVGLRQFCDLAMVLHATSQNIDSEVLKADLTAMKMVFEWQLVCNVLVKYMGMPVTEVPMYADVDDKKVNAFLKLVLDDGNFGTNRYTHKGKSGYFKTKYIKATLDAHRSLQLAKVSVSMAAKVYLGRFLQGMGSTLKGR